MTKIKIQTTKMMMSMITSHKLKIIKRKIKMINKYKHKIMNYKIMKIIHNWKRILKKKKPIKVI
jgi:hypothetical protein